MATKQVLTEQEAVEFLGGIHKVRTLREWRRLYRNTGVLKGPMFVELETKVGYRIRDLEDYLEANTARPKESA